VLVWVATAYVVPFFEQFSVTLSAPDTIGDLSRTHTDEDSVLANEFRLVVQGTNAVSALYYTAADPVRAIRVVAAAVLSLDPAGRLNSAFQHPVWSQTSGNGTDVDPGPLGGVARCGYERDGTGVCAWADYGSAGLVEADGRTSAETAELMRTVRAAVVHR
jgi:hypothetical protein